MKPSTRAFLAASAAGMIGIVGIPLAVYPRKWSKVAGWNDPPDTPVGDYLARSLGAIGLALGAACLRAIVRNAPPRDLIVALTAIGAGATFVHARGALRGTYPIREGAEVPALLLWTLWGARELT